MSRIDWRRWAWRAGTATALLVLLGLLLSGRYELLLGSVAGSAAGPARPAPCLPGEPVPVQDSPHISPAEADRVVGYRSRPATSGPHFAFPVAPGIYSAPLPEGLTVHALEHGHVAIQYAPDLPEEQVAALTRTAKRYGSDVLLAPYPGLEPGIALTAWGRIDTLAVHQEDRIVAFIERLRGRYRHGWTGQDEC